jgi:hypothetical protein
LVKQKVKIKRYKTMSEIAKNVIPLNDSHLDRIEEQDDGLSIYGNDDEVTEE